MATDLRQHGSSDWVTPQRHGSRSTSYTMPGKPRHGTVLPVTRAEHDRLLRAYG